MIEKWPKYYFVRFMCVLRHPACSGRQPTSFRISREHQLGSPRGGGEEGQHRSFHVRGGGGGEDNLPSASIFGRVKVSFVLTKISQGTSSVKTCNIYEVDTYICTCHGSPLRRRSVLWAALDLIFFLWPVRYIKTIQTMEG